MKKPYIFNIQKFSVHDGPGIRTTIFFKGCPIKCKWCHNPESQNYQPELMENKEGIKQEVGKQYEIEELVKIVQKDQIFYDQSGGGVTLSGGECFSQNPEYIISLVKELDRIGVSVAIDTCGEFNYESYKEIIPLVDIFLYDLKFLDDSLHIKYTEASNKLVLDNLIKLNDVNANINLRMILLEGINSNDKSINDIISWLKANKIRINNINLLPYHVFGSDKYRRLERIHDEEEFEAPSEQRLNEIDALLNEAGYQVKIGG
ncbi:MAG: glycyl-radical enzyme activating protein [Erysipelotrichales bacterium]